MKKAASGGKKKKGKAFGNFGQSPFSVDDGKGVSFEKALNTVKDIETTYSSASTSDSKLSRKVSKITQEKTLKTLQKSDFSWTDLSTNYISFIESVYSKLKNLKESEPVRFDWTGVEHFSDAVFGHLLEKTKLPGYNYVLGIVLTGCCNLTDIGVKWMSQCFPKLKEVTLAGCLKVTETGVYSLVTKCTELKSLDLTATNVAILPSQLVGKDVDVPGCPMVSPSEAVLQQTEGLDVMKAQNYKKPDSKNMVKVCLIHPQGFKTNIMSQITGEKLTKRESLAFKAEIRLKNTDIMANIIEFEEGMIDMFVFKRSVILVPYEHDETKPLEDLVTWLFSVYCQVLNKASRATVLFVALVKDGNTKVNHHAAAFELKTKKAKELLIKQKQKLMQQKGTSEIPLTKLDQDNFTHTKELVDMLGTQAENVKFITAVKEGMQVNNSLIHEILLACEKTIKLYPEYEEISSHVYQYICSDTSQKMFASSTLTGALSVEGASPSSAKTIELLHLFGKLLYIDTVDAPPLVMDIKWLSTFLSNLVPETNAGMFPYVSETTKVVSLLKADKKLVDAKLADENSICLMPKIGLGMNTRNAYLGYGQLENEPPITMDEYMGKKENVQEICCKYILVHGLTSDVMYQLFTYTSYVRKPILMWRNGIVLLENLAQIVIQLKNNADNPCLELVVQSSNADTGNLKELIPKVLVHSAKKMKIIIEYILSSRGIPFQIELQEKLSQKVAGMHGIVLDHEMYAREGGAYLCKFCGTSSRQSNFLLELKRHIYIQDTSFKLDQETEENEETDSTTKKNGESEIAKEGENVISLGTELSSFKDGSALPDIKILTVLEPYEQREINFTALALDTEEDVKIELRMGFSKKVALSYSFKTGYLVRGHQSKNLYEKDQLGKTVSLIMKPLYEGDKNWIQLKISVNGEAQVQYTFPFNLYVPVIVPGPASKPANMKSVVMVHGHRNWKSGAGKRVQPGMRLEALDRKNPSLICAATVEDIYDDGTLVIHFDGWTDRYDYTCEPSTVDIHPIGWFEASTGQPFMRKYDIRLQAPKGYQYSFDWPSYCERTNCVPVPFNFFSDEQKGLCTDHAINEVYEHLVIPRASGDYREAVSCSRTTIPGAYLEHSMLSLRDSMTEEMVGFFSNHRQFLFLLPEKFNVINLRFPSLTSMMNIKNQKVHFACSGHRMELLHLVDHAGLPLQHYLTESTEIDISHLYAYLEMIYMGLLVQSRVLPWELNKLCPGIDSSDEMKLELLEMGFKRIFFQYLLWSHAYNYSFESTINKPKKIDRSTVLPAKILRDEKSVKSLSSAFHIMSGTGVIRCEGHTMSVMPQSDMKSINSEQFRAYAQFMHKFEFQNNGIENLPDNFFTMFNALSELNLADNQLKSLPEGFSGLKNLEILDISGNHLTALPKDFVAVKETLETLNISSNPLDGIPSEIFMMTNLQVLYANNLGNVNLCGIGKLSSLEKLYLASNLILEFPEELSSLDQLTHLDLSGLPWFPEFLEQKIQPNFSTFKSAMNGIMVFKEMTEEQIKELFLEVDKDSNGILDNDELQQINKVILEKYTRFGRGRLYYHDSAIDPVIWKLKSLKVLCLRFHAFTMIPDSIKDLTELESLDVSHNPDLITLSAQLGGLPLTQLHLVGCPSLRTPPKEIVSRGFNVVYGYLRRLMQGSVECKRTKLMVVGLGGAGKTSLIRAMTQVGFSAYHDYGEQITDGIDITTWDVAVPGKDKDSKISYSVWDFAGQTVYYNTHQFFLSNRACYLLLWNIRLGYEHAGLEFWLSSIACHAPKAPILVVGTHCDKVEKSRIPQKDLKATYPQIAGFHFVSSYSGEGIENMRQKLVEVTLKQKYMGERIPEAWLSLEKHVLERRKKDDLIPFKDVKAMGQHFGILDESELIQAVQFLHDLGSLQFFNTEFLRSLVVIVPQWIVDVMACVVTVHVGPIQEGKMLHKDMSVIWEKYPADLHPWLLRLTEEFDLTFPLSDEDANLVPCLLPDTEKELYWPALDVNSGLRETKAIYNFKYLPAGLFNRAQVRLQQYSESGQLWKKGMFLKKNNHIAVIRQKGQCQLELKAQGFKPENILFLVDEVISTLIAESYSGVYYDLMVPCLECQNLGMSDPSMFSSAKIHRAVELNAPFVQCDSMFHVLSIPELKSLMPPNKTTEFDEHLRRSVMELKDLGDDVNIRVIFCYSKKNIPDLQQENKLVHPGRIMEDLRKDGFDVSICDNPETADVESLTIAFKSAQVILFGVSDDFCADETCKKLLIFAKETLNKPILLVTLGSSLAFLKTSIGLNITDEVFVKMTDAARYEPKIIELKEALKKKKSKGGAEDVPKVFLSYCWSNSHDAISKGSNKLDGALGFGDPRKIAQVIQESKVVCWLDIERVGNAGLFDDIADGLRKAKVMVACVSDEYANSRNCKMEFRFAVAKLKIPTVLAVVGTGYNWESSEIGMLAVGSKCPKINFQIENQAGFLQVLQEIRKYVDTEDEQSAGETTEERKKNAFKEIIESTERQFLRNLIQFKEKSFTADYPRLVVINLVDKEKERKEEEERKQAEAEAEAVQQRTDDWEEEEKPTTEEKPEGREANYCFSLLCENEEGWHDVPQTILFPEFTNNEEEEEYLSAASPYAARINLILKYTGQQMAVMTTPAGKQLQEKLESRANTVTSEDEVDKAYISIIKDIIVLDENHTYGGLKKTTLLNGKSLWLCEKHREQVGSITEQRYRTQLKPTELEAEKPQREKTFVEVPSAKVSTSAAQNQSAVAASSLKVADQSKNTVFKTRATKSPLKRQTSQACSVM